MRTDDAGCGDGEVWMAWRHILKVGIDYILNVEGERERERIQGWLPGSWLEKFSA